MAAAPESTFRSAYNLFCGRERERERRVKGWTMRSISTKWMLRGIILFYRVGSARERRAAGRVTLCVLEGTSLCVSFIFLFLCDAKKRERELVNNERVLSLAAFKPRI